MSLPTLLSILGHSACSDRLGRRQTQQHFCWTAHVLSQKISSTVRSQYWVLDHGMASQASDSTPILHDKAKTLCGLMLSWWDVAGVNLNMLAITKLPVLRIG